MALSKKTETLLVAYGTACIRYGSAEPNSRAEAKAEGDKEKAREELYAYLEILERCAGINTADVGDDTYCIFCDQQIPHAKCDGG